MSVGGNLVYHAIEYRWWGEGGKGVVWVKKTYREKDYNGGFLYKCILVEATSQKKVLDNAKSYEFEHELLYHYIQGEKRSGARLFLKVEFSQTAISKIHFLHRVANFSIPSEKAAKNSELVLFLSLLIVGIAVFFRALRNLQKGWFYHHSVRKIGASKHQT